MSAFIFPFAGFLAYLTTAATIVFFLFLLCFILYPPLLLPDSRVNMRRQHGIPMSLNASVTAVVVEDR